MMKNETYMRRALELAELGRGYVSPNPLVGCVIVYEDRIIGEGYHIKYGGPHAEVNAIRDVEDQRLLTESTVYVTLEPCAHFGKTPPCADLLVEKRVKKVVIAAVDSNPLVGGKGIEKLEKAGIQVEWGLLEKQARQQNSRFFTFMEKKRPYILLKWAQTRDGFVARANYDSKWISNSHSRQQVHKWRAEEQGIMVGTKTAHFDNPRLNVRGLLGKNPVRIVIDKKLTLDPNSHLFDKSIPTICYNHVKNEEMENLTFVRLEEEFSMEALFGDLYDKKVQSVLVEGGSFLLQKLISANLWDEARVFTGSPTFGTGIPAPIIDKPAQKIEGVFGDRLEYYFNH
ncbi:bifunctional diaminohydroxyphosphoribosylaminopyrimidine deaminase/5-amino-6-(5-phosphoribosylamino)uracil reductase RibD [Litoribacter ruber]|uniref:Riboflavin biosynthesis protein RibD n=1 Tax=Litoribacter ruber TaxID=702568 RepID=A0AAP2G172_9BACT|nr:MULTISPECIES: bifunctional diaminohydroxyphosphoribosylaminopyrimidine deaminase/5-amino-6-(5-phosphoribosylamino)uracil reductase RibD [Litoribacter]MBS9523657.1 bifunctional diaminohydroxyphosphoribosylaminopyrimidine deaminase/5-amino-6-(5-phosphoribosylamino)uracil reductase RibD [Litoribacter alkaliphilus]MBT0812171.1 bifunctional diaminohydroxyphosphoribosylaminopyrimidine deaminase/5-amino-6-(5-phosphoribosylamino)uracil reductase RibD [Litoribacter ruber]